MKTMKFALTLSGMALAGSALAADIEGAAKAPFENVLGNAYGTAEISHHLKHKAKKEDSSVRVDALYTLGTKLFNEKLDIYATVGVKKHNNESHLSQKSTDIQADYYAYTGDYLTFMPYALVSAPYVDSSKVAHSTEGRFGFNLEPHYDVSTGAGVFSFHSEYDLTGTFNSRAQQVSVYDKDGDLVVDEAGVVKKAESQSLGLRQVIGAKVAYTPNMIDGLYLELQTSHKVVGTPKMVQNEAGKAELDKAGTGLSNYNHVGGTSHRLRIRYNVNEDLYVQNDLTFFNKKDGDDRQAYENVLGVTATLF